MQKEQQSGLESEKWTTIRDITVGGSGMDLPKYEAKYVTDVTAEYVEDDVVLVKRTNPYNGDERIHHYPRELFERVAERLP